MEYTRDELIEIKAEELACKEWELTLTLLDTTIQAEIMTKAGELVAEELAGGAEHRMEDR